MKAIILAAGNGKRLYPYTKNIPKCLLDIGGETLLEHQIDNLRVCGIDEAVIVVGYESDKVENFVADYDWLGMRLKILYNPFYRTTNSLISLWIARGEIDQDVVLMNGDDLFEPEVLERALYQNDEIICLPVKKKAYYEKEDMKVIIDGTNIIRIGKDLTTKVSAESVGVRIFRDRGVELLKRAVEEEIRTDGAFGKWYVSAVQRLIEKAHKINSIDIGDLFWMDVDYPSDLFKARDNSYIFLKKPHREKMLAS
ncbi:MAG: phosphocholine cytidylyltransferase family protein [Thermodesulfobacteriota bacterium]